MEDEEIRSLLGKAFLLARGTQDENFERQKWNFVFHMTDWYDDLETLHQLFSSPTQWNADDACEFLVGFLAHAVPHLDAAAKLMLGDVANPFSE